MNVSWLRLTRRTWLLAGTLLLLLLVWALFHRQIDRRLAVCLLLNSKNPSEEYFHDLANQSDDPVDFLNRCWATGKVVHRQFVAAFLKDNAAANSPWFARAEPLVLTGVTDADASVRELALATLAAIRSPRLLESAQAQLDDLDPTLRLRGMDYLRMADRQDAVPVLMRLLDDPDLRVVAGAEVALMRRSGEDFGVRARLAIVPKEGAQAGLVDPANVEKIQRGVDRRKEWWQLHAKEYPASGRTSVRATTGDSSRLPAPDFTLTDLNGKSVHLTDLRGKVVLLNFWATWCTACLAEIPDLVALQNKLGNSIAIIGVSLDGVPDEHGHVPGQKASDKSEPHEHPLKTVQAKVERAVKARRINYPVLLDPENSVGGQYNGGELPTTVIIDAQGRVRRRFIGERSLGVFEAMVAEAARLAPTP